VFAALFTYLGRYFLNVYRLARRRVVVVVVEFEIRKVALLILLVLRERLSDGV
jgi:hypothetical protein